MKFIQLYLICYLIILPSGLFAAVFAEDGRQTIDSRHAGALLCANPETKKVISIGTASLVTISDNNINSIIMTNEHVIRNMQDGSWYECWFTLNADIKKKYKLTPQRAFGGKFESGQVFDDWAFVKLVDTINAEDASSLKLFVSPDDILNEKKPNYSLLAYNSGAEGNDQFTNEMTLSTACRVFMADESPLFKKHEYDKLLITDCDCYEGCSGAPVIYKSNEQKLAIGIYYGSYFASQYYLGGNQRFTSFDLFQYVNGAIRITKEHIVAFKKLTEKK